MATVRAVVFDAYGTLLDFASAAERAGDTLGERWRALADLWRRKQLEYTWLRSLMRRHVDFWQVTGEALDFSLQSLGIHDPELRKRLMDLYLHLEAFPDARCGSRGCSSPCSPTGRRGCSTPASGTPGSTTCSTWSCRSRRSGSTSLHPRFMRWRRASSTCSRARSGSSRPTRGTPTAPAPSASGWPGATGPG